MKRKWLIITSLLMFGALALVSCGKKNNTTTTDTSDGTTIATTESTNEATTTSEATTAEVTTEEATTAPEATTEEILEPKVNEVTKGTGTFSGQIDSSSVEILLDNGNYETFFIYDEKVAEFFNNLEEGDKISFTYGPAEGQINPEITAVEKK